jgi:hypothetical protein
MPGKRSPVNLARRAALKLVFEHAFLDKEKGEIVSTLDRADIVKLLSLGEFRVSDVPDVEKGEVLVDSRGEGSLQRRNQPKCPLKR